MVSNLYISKKAYSHNQWLNLSDSEISIKEKMSVTLFTLKEAQAHNTKTKTMSTGVSVSKFPLFIQLI